MACTNDKTWKYDYIPTPVTTSEYEELVKSSVPRCLSWLNSPDWKFESNKNEVMLKKKKFAGSEIIGIMATIYIKNANLADILRFSYSPTMDEKRFLHNEVLQYETIGTINNNAHVSYSLYGMPTGIANRDFLVIRCLNKLDDGSHLITVSSINNSTVPFSPKLVRGVSNCCAHIVQNQNMIKITTIYHVDPKGFIPAVFVNMYTGRVGEELVKIRNLFQNKL